ncbi:hypothetical protein K0T92_09655 [Paenibacillus oenotherae]|uniref:Uncharacterized protein n=1 Tax=Paenibacillus oenotherae TaxID=1435645 RepID=A0ABS7D4Z6_9BACL|nr:hypothetical protein [Paenibacillus oenotherae]MBW7475010.1 hypothetical protein [Paenibacillus oenotherae]
MLKQKAMILVAVVAISAGIAIGTQWPTRAEGEAAQAAPGSVDDPVVTKSYVDGKIAGLTGSNNGGKDGSTQEGTKEAESVKIVNVSPGQMLIAKDGSEAVVRAGKAVAYSPDSNGIADVTDGTDIKSGSRVLNNHLILFPRGGRGLMPESGQKNGLTVMVTGGYEIKDQIQE